jgi:hypothetical protein
VTALSAPSSASPRPPASPPHYETTPPKTSGDDTAPDFMKQYFALALAVALPRANHRYDHGRGRHCRQNHGQVRSEFPAESHGWLVAEVDENEDELQASADEKQRGRARWADAVGIPPRSIAAAGNRPALAPGSPRGRGTMRGRPVDVEAGAKRR